MRRESGTYTSRRVRLLSVNIFEQLLQAKLKGFIFASLVELAEKMTACSEGGVGKSQSCIAEILSGFRMRICSDGQNGRVEKN